MLKFREFIEKAIRGNGVQSDSSDVWVVVDGFRFTVSIDDVMDHEEAEPFEASAYLESNLDAPAWDDLYEQYCKEHNVDILVEDGCTRSEAEKHLNNGTTIFEDFEENFDSYMKEWNCDEEEKEAFKKMIDSKNPVPDWGVVELDGKTYYIMYIL